MTTSLVQAVPSKKKSFASHGVGAGVVGGATGTNGSTGTGVGTGVLHISKKSQLPFMYEPAPNASSQQLTAVSAVNVRQNELQYKIIPISRTVQALTIRHGTIDDVFVGTLASVEEEDLRIAWSGSSRGRGNYSRDRYRCGSVAFVIVDAASSLNGDVHRSRSKVHVAAHSGVSIRTARSRHDRSRVGADTVVEVESHVARGRSGRSREGSPFHHRLL
jgi:hypothetical protein